MDGFSDLLSDAFSEASVPSFSDGDLDFENLNFDEKSEEDKAEDFTTKTEEALLQEATAQSAASSEKANTDSLFRTENAYEEQSDDEGVEESFTSKTPEDDYTSSEEEDSSSGEDEEVSVGTAEEQGDLLVSVCSSDILHDAEKEDRIFAEGQPVASEGADSPKVSNKVQDEAESDEEDVSYFGEIPEEDGDEAMMKNTETEEDNQEEEVDSSDSESEGMKIEQEEDLHPQEVENPYKINPEEDSVEFPCLSLQNLQDLVDEVDGEECVDDMRDFTGEEHQEAGESFADYPSEFSSSENGAEGNNQELSAHSKQEACLERGVTESPWTAGTEDSDHGKDEEFLYSQDLEMNADEIMSLEERKSEHLLAMRDESSSHGSSDDEEPRRRTSDELSDSMRVRDVDNKETPKDVQLHVDSSVSFSSWSRCDEYNINHRADSADFTRSDFDVLKTDTLLSEYLFTTEDPLSDLNPCPAEDVNCYSVVEREETKTGSHNQGSIDDSFFFNTELETSEVTEVRQLTDEEYEEKRNMELMQERIEAFKRFYDNSDDENGGKERQIKVQFCADPLSQIIHYETDSSDSDSLSSSTDREEDEEDEEDEDEEERRNEEEERQEEEEVEGEEREEEDEEEEEREEEEEEERQEKEEEEWEEEEEEKEREDEEEEEEEERLEKEEEERRDEDEEEEKEEEEDLSSVETYDELREPEETLQMKPVCDPANIPQSPSDVRDVQTCTKTHKGFGFLKLMVKLGVMTITGLLTFWLIADQPDWIRDLFSV